MDAVLGDGRREASGAKLFGQKSGDPSLVLAIRMRAVPR
jgi:hypothetical protein